MENIVQVNQDLYLNIVEAVKIEARGKTFVSRSGTALAPSRNTIAIPRHRDITN